MKLFFGIAVVPALMGAPVALSSAQAADLDGYVLRGSQTPFESNYGGGLMNEDTEFGLRAWLSTGKLEKTLYGAPSSGLGAVSRLRYDGLIGYSGEAFGRVGVAGWSFFKGAVSLGTASKGNLQDEDFEPLTDPYSSTQSTQRKGALDYATLDYGVDVLRDPMYRVAVLAGVNYFRETANAYGCTQSADNPDICSPGQVSPGTLAITENASWVSARVGLSADVLLFDRLRLGAEAAWVPYVALSSVDNHWLRTDIGPINEKGHGRNGAQLEATADYKITDNVSLGAGLRYWRMKAQGDANFVDASGTPLGTQPVAFVTERLGAFVQASYRFQ